ncbi:hypothetical protein Hanom_Chr11g00995311 [Helianthus anomalus]
MVDFSQLRLFFLFFVFFFFALKLGFLSGKTRICSPTCTVSSIEFLNCTMWSCFVYICHQPHLPRFDFMFDYNFGIFSPFHSPLPSQTLVNVSI